MNVDANRAVAGRLRSKLVEFALAGLALAACGEPSSVAPDDVDTNTAPAATVTGGGPASVGLPVTLLGAGTDPDGDALTYAWVLQAPAGSSASLDDATATSASFTPDVAGDYTGTLIVSDGTDDSAPAATTVAATERTTRATISSDGGSAVSDDGSFRITYPVGWFAAETVVELTAVGASQAAVLGESLAEAFGADEGSVAYRVREAASPSAHAGPAGAAPAPSRTEHGEMPVASYIKTVAQSENSDTSDSREHLGWSVGPSGVFGPLSNPRTDIDLREGTATSRGEFTSVESIAFVPGPLRVGFAAPARVEVGQRVTVTLSGMWLWEEVGPAEVEIGSTASAPLEPFGANAGAPYRLPMTERAFLTELTYSCEDVGTGTISLSVDLFESVGNPPEARIGRTTIEGDIECTSDEMVEDILTGFTPVGTDPRIEDVKIVPRTFAGAAARGPVALTAGREGVRGVDLGTGLVVIDGIDASPSNPFTRLLPLAVPTADPLLPGATAVFASGIDFGNPLAPVGGVLSLFDYDSRRFSEGTPVEGAFYQLSPVHPKGGIDTYEFWAVNNYGARYFEFSEEDRAWIADPDALLTRGRYDGFGGQISAVVAAQPGAPLLVVVYTNLTRTSDLYLDNRLDDPVLIGELGGSVADLKCFDGWCATVMAREDRLRFFPWDGESAPTIDYDPIPVGIGPSMVALDRLSNGNTVAYTFHGFDDDVVTRSEWDDTGALRSNVTWEIGEAGCRGPRSGAVVPDEGEPDNPYLAVGCWGSDGVFVDKFPR